MAHPLKAQAIRSADAKLKMLSGHGHEDKADERADRAMIRDAVHRHEKRMHPGEKETPLKRGGKAVHRLDRPDRKKGRAKRASGGILDFVGTPTLSGYGVADSTSSTDKFKKKTATTDTADTGDLPYKKGGRAQRKKGGRVGKTNVNVIISQPPEHPAMPMMPPPMPHPVAPPMGAAPVPRPPMPPVGMPGAAPAPGMPGMMPRRDGGGAFKRGGAVKDGGAWKEGLKNGTQVSHSPGKNDLTKDELYTKPPKLTRKRGGRALGMTAGAGSGEGREQKVEMQKRTYP